MKDKKLTIVNLILAGLLLCGASLPAQAALVWEIRLENPPVMVGPMDTVVIRGVLINSPASDQHLGVISGGVLGEPPGFDFEIGAVVYGACGDGNGWQYGPNGSLQSQFHGVDLAPGQTFNFVLGSCVPPSGGFYLGLSGVTVDLQLFESSAARPMVGRSYETVRWLVSDVAPLITCEDVLAQVSAERDQCNADLSATNIFLSNTQSELGVCLARPVWSDQDGDGEDDKTDACPGTPAGAAVDQGGCSQSQICTKINATTRVGQKLCRAIDWLNNEPLTSPGDCMVVKQGGTTLCVAAP